ncbi:TIGR04141 family sporadically distributed protein [Mycobacteroides abscessus subsp. abscessus]|uniref:DUF6119 family protein n=1 Tax=Mycobacteroides abscessus TaxID=36809 RepID=UPI00266D2357|nr:DUF6119 family protein [Mycobacteroides abscessus]MDO3002859.1 TIGR04141 family sporadically distributed protein [Mycobacteroides abscessus subsp. abscessus]MDO3199265.1 TIGR04141 family sporadically distributed protein [Mycobacteroides abscessus subsp. abscessus]MDO3282796.1 TIGR04141 family sporadically distributed protein [Mycobacteroides abscessus subsp. abscessus]
MAPKAASSASATTLYRLTGVNNLQIAVRKKYLNDEKFQSVACSVGDREALLVHGHMKTARVAWAERLGSLIKVPFEASNQNAAAVLLIKGQAHTVWALAYGMGFHVLDQGRVDPGFGQRVAIRVAEADNLSSLTSKTMDNRAKVDRSSIPSGSQLSGFGLGDFGQLVTRVVATARIDGLTVGKAFKVRGADALNLPLACSAESLLADLTLIEETLKTEPPTELRILEQLFALKKDNPTTIALDKLLEMALLDASDENAAVAWPHEGVNENGTPAAFVVKGRGPKVPREGVPTIHAIRDAINPKNVLASLNQTKIQLFSDPDGQNPISSDIALRKWIAFEQTLDGQRYFLHDGRWYLMDQNYAAQLQARVHEIFDQTYGLTLPPWPYVDGEKICEKKYNELAAPHIGGWVLDRKLIRTIQNRRGFETCDILAPDGALIHVKNADASAPISHLFAQGHNSAHCLTHDQQAREEFGALVAKVGGDQSLVADKPTAVVFAIARHTGKPFGPNNLYSFSQVTLVRTAEELAARGIKVYVAPIENGPCDR